MENFECEKKDFFAGKNNSKLKNLLNQKNDNKKSTDDVKIVNVKKSIKRKQKIEDKIEKKEKNNTNQNLSLEAENLSSFIKTQNNINFINNIHEIENDKNQINFLIGTDEIETGLVYLKNNSYTEKIKADKSFSILILKGFVNIIVNGNEVQLKKYGMIVINKNDIYEILGFNGYTSVLFLTFSLK
ncbi:hypothetical protein GVAV_002818 [Gurleya vavrai]